MRGVDPSVRPWLLLLWLVLPLSARGEEAVRETEEIVVEDERLRPAEVFEDTAIETEVIEREKIEALPARDVSDIVGRLPGIRTQQRVQGEDAAVSIEGMPPEYTKVLVNGARYTGEIGGVSDLADIPTHNVERIEVLRGNQGVRYGTDAAGGVINVITRQAPESGVGFDLDGGVGQDGQVKGFGTTGFHLGRLGVTVSGGHYEIDGFDAPPGDQRFTRSQAGNEDSERLERHFYSTFDYALSPQLDLYARVGWRREDWDFAQDEPEEGETGPQQIGAFEGTDSSHLQRDYDTWTSTAGFRFRPGEATTVTGDVNYFTGHTDSEVGREFVQDEDQYQVNLSGEHLVETGPISHALLAALDWRRSSLALDNGPLPPNIDSTAIRGSDVDEWFYQTGLYLETESAFSEWASLVLGLRLQTHSRFDDALLPQVALLLRPHESLKLRFSWGENQRTPSLRDLYQPESPQLGGTYFLAGNPDLQPENSQSWRASFEWSPHRIASLAVVGFWNDFDDSIRAVLTRDIAVGSNVAEGTGTLPESVLLDLLELCSDPLVNFRLIGCDVFSGGTGGAGVVTGVTAPVYEKVNLDAVRTRGVEVRLNVRPYDPLRLELELGYTLLDTEVRDSDRPDLDELPNEPKHVVDGRLFFTLPRIGTDFALTASWRDRAVIETSGTGLLGFSDPTSLSDPAFLLDVRIAQPLPRWPNVQVYLDAINLTDTRVIDSYAIRGRTFFVGVRASFHPTGLPAWMRGGRSAPAEESS
jgi:outer membrane receptor for ferrienterochelin and colicins